MALPEGISICTVTAGVPVTHGGGAVKTYVSIEPSVFLVHTATGTPLVDFLEELQIAEGVAGQFTLPHTDQPGFQDENGNTYTNWYYTARVTYSTPSKAKTKAPKIKVFQLATGQTLVDLDSLPGGAPALPYTAPLATVTSVNGATGAVTVTPEPLPARLEEAALNATILTEGKKQFADSGLSRWRRKLITKAADVKLLFMGDSTSDPATAPDLAQRIKDIHLASSRGLSGMLPANVLMVGHGGEWQENWISTPARVAEVVDPQPDLIVYSLGINSVRTGGRTQAQLTAGIIGDIDYLRGAVPGADIILRVPQPFSSDDPTGNGFVTPLASAQAYTDLLRNAYLSLDGRWPNVVVWNAQDRVFGRTSKPFAQYGGMLSDQIHPSPAGYKAIADALVADLLGVPTRYTDTASVARAAVDMFAASRAIPKYKVGDLMQRADSATSAGTATTGQAYTNRVNALGILGNRVYSPSGTASIADLDAGIANGEFGVTFAKVDPSAGGGSILVFRLSGQYDYIYLRRYTTSLILGKQVAGANTSVSTVTAPTAADGDRLAVECNGTQIKAYLNDVLMITATVAEHTANTRIGIQINDSTSRAVDLYARAL